MTGWRVVKVQGIAPLPEGTTLWHPRITEGSCCVWVDGEGPLDLPMGPTADAAVHQASALLLFVPCHYRVTHHHTSTAV